MSKRRLLVVGGTGYLGQHILQSLSQIQGSPYDVAFTHHSLPPSHSLLQAFPRYLAFHVDLRTGVGFEAISERFGQPDVVANCAALSVPRACEQDPQIAMTINVPASLVKWLSGFSSPETTLLIHLSTDQVYEGVKSYYKEDDEAVPVNAYGKSKVASEQFISKHCANYAILRSSIIYGPQTVSPVPKSLPVQWMDNVLSKGDPVEFFHDEFRCPIYVKDLVSIVLSLTIRWLSEGNKMQLLLNVGGPDRVSRVQMAEVVAQVRGYDVSLIKSVTAASVDRGVNSPADISMDITRLVQTLDVSLTSFKDGAKLTLSC